MASCLSLRLAFLFVFNRWKRGTSEQRLNANYSCCVCAEHPSDQGQNGINGGKPVGRRRLCRIWAGELAPALNTPIVVYCASGEHCTSAVQVLRDLGYLNVGSLIGGLQGWLEAGGLVESSGGRNSGSSRQTRPIWARSDW